MNIKDKKLKTKARSKDLAFLFAFKIRLFGADGGARTRNLPRDRRVL